MLNFTLLGCLELVKKFVVVVVVVWVAECKFSVLLWSKPFSLKFKFWNWTKLNIKIVIEWAKQGVCTCINKI